MAYLVIGLLLAATVAFFAWLDRSEVKRLRNEWEAWNG